MIEPKVTTDALDALANHDRFAIAAMNALIATQGVSANTLDMDLAKLSDTAYRIATHMVDSRTAAFKAIVHVLISSDYRRIG